MNRMKPTNGVEYTAFFVDRNDLEKALKKVRNGPGLGRDILYPHVTTEFHPQNVDKSLFGAKVDIVIDGYGRNEENEGFRVSLSSDSLPLQSEIDKITDGGSVPHITTSVSETGKPVNTRYVDFQPVEPMVIQGVYGGFCNNRPQVMPEKQRQLPDVSFVQALDNVKSVDCEK